MSTFRNTGPHAVPFVVGDEVVMVPPGGEVGLTPPTPIPDQTQGEPHEAAASAAQVADEDEARKTARNKQFQKEARK